MSERDLPVPAKNTDLLYLDSLSLAWLVHSLDVEFDVQVELTDSGDESFSSVAALVDFVNKRIRT